MDIDLFLTKKIVITTILQYLAKLKLAFCMNSVITGKQYIV